MKKQYFSPDQDGFYGAYYPNSTSSKKAMIIMLGESSDDYMVVSAAKWLHKRGCNVMAMSPVQKGAGYYDYPLRWIGHGADKSLTIPPLPMMAMTNRTIPRTRPEISAYKK